MKNSYRFWTIFTLWPLLSSSIEFFSHVSKASTNYLLNFNSFHFHERKEIPWNHWLVLLKRHSHLGIFHVCCVSSHVVLFASLGGVNVEILIHGVYKGNNCRRRFTLSRKCGWEADGTWQSWGGGCASSVSMDDTDDPPYIWCPAEQLTSLSWQL